jgi:transposase
VSRKTIGLSYFLSEFTAAWCLLGTFECWYSYDQTRRWFNAGLFDAVVQDFREFLRLAQGMKKDPSTVIFDGRTLQSTPESGTRVGYDGHKKKRGSKLRMAVDTIGHLLVLLVTPANEQERAQVYEFSELVQEVTDESVDVNKVNSISMLTWGS